jgi:hypothetical protein
MFVIKSSVSDCYVRDREEGVWDLVRDPARATAFTTAEEAAAFADRHGIGHGVVVDADDEVVAADGPDLGGEG